MTTVNIVCPHCGAAFDAQYDAETTKSVVVECVGCRTSLSIINYLPADMNRDWYRRQREMRGKRAQQLGKSKMGLPSLSTPVAPEESGARAHHLERRPINSPKPLTVKAHGPVTAAGAEKDEVIVEQFQAPKHSVQPATPLPPVSLPPSDSVIQAVGASQLYPDGMPVTALVDGNQPYVPTAFGDGKIVNPKPLLNGDFGPFKIEAEISRGGMGAVYRAIDTRATDDLQKCVALKVLLSGPAATPEETSRFRREALAHGKLSHPNLVMVYDAGEVEGRQYIAMELIQGQSLDKLIRMRPMSIHETLEMMRAVCDAMGTAHEQGIIHRDIKPANILIDQMNNPKITDFGLARNLEEITRTTRSGMVMGTPAYMSPEQAEGRSDIGPETDVWSMGTVMYEMLTGKPPFFGDTAIRLALRITQDEPRSPRNLNPEIPMEVEAIVLKCLRKDPAMRYPTAGSLGADIANFLEGRPVRAAYGSRRKPSKAAQLALAGAVVAVLGVAGAWGLSTFLGKASNATVQGDPGVDYQKAYQDGLDYLNRSQLAQAEQALRLAAKGLNDGKAQFYLGQVVGLQAIDVTKHTVLDQKKLDEAEKFFAWARQLNPALTGDSYSKMGAINLFCNRNDEAIKCYRDQLAAAPRSADAMYELAYALVKTAKAHNNDAKMLTEAKGYCAAALKIDPNHEKAKTLAGALK